MYTLSKYKLFWNANLKKWCLCIQIICNLKTIQKIAWWYCNKSAAKEALTQDMGPFFFFPICTQYNLLKMKQSRTHRIVVNFIV